MKWLLALVALAVPGLALANADVANLTKDPKNWAMQAGDFPNKRYSELKQINEDNVKNLRVAWTFSTGVLRGYFFTSSTRRFSALPSSLRLSATGRSWPKPAAESLLASMPAATMATTWRP
jgi:hypothetical protein